MEKRHLPINWELLSRYASGQADTKDQQELKAWLEKKPANRQILEEVVGIFEADRRLSESERYRHYEVNKAFELFKERTRIEQPFIKKSKPLVRISAAAGILLLLGFFAYILGTYRNTFFGPPLSAKGDAAANDVAWHKYTAASGSFLNIDLGDGTSVRLSPGSTLQYPESFGRKDRLVKLEGEAYFDVVKDAQHPFIVQTGKFSTRVLGTSFNVEAYSQLLFSKVTLITGKIAISRSASAEQPDSVVAILTPNESITLSNEDTSYSISKIKPEKADAIKNGKLVFDGTPMKEVAYKLERYYGIKVQLENAAIGNIAFTGTFEHIPLKDITDMIAEATGLRIEQDGNVVAIRLPL